MKPKPTLTEITKDPQKRCEWVFSRPMKPCPKCKGYNIHFSVPIKLLEPLPSDARGILKVWARAHKNGDPELKGTASILCHDCGHNGPNVDVTGRNYSDVSRDKRVADEVKTKWNNQELEK